MASYRICTLFSGSKGNCTYIETPRAKILIDMGKNCKAVSAALAEIGVSPDALDAVFITHEHRDHVDALSVFCKHHPLPIHVQRASAERIYQNAPHLGELLHVYPDAASCQVQVGDMTVQAFRTPHDSRASVGYRITIDGEAPTTIAYATDIGHVTDEIMQNLLYVNERFGLCDPDADRWREIDERLVDYVIDRDGVLGEFTDGNEAISSSHRHLSHIYGLFPASLFDNDEKQNEDIMKAKSFFEKLLKELNF